MRYYSIIISDPATGQVLAPSGLGGVNAGATYTSFVNGQTIPGAQNIELNVPVSVFATPLGAAYVRVWGISLQEISQANDLVGKNIKVFAGMQKGLPLAKPAQAGLILQGEIIQAFGNWVGTDMTLDMIVFAGTGTIDDPKNIVHSWQKGTKLSEAITPTLTTAFPDHTVNVKISDKLVLTETDTGYYQALDQYAQYIKNVSKGVLGGDYQGVDITLKEKTFTVFDGTSSDSPTLIAFEDMIGQPTWIDQLTAQFKATMRADLSIGETIKFPPSAVTTTASGAAILGSGLKLSSVFQGTFLIVQATHFGNYRQPDAASWNTTFNVVPTRV